MSREPRLAGKVAVISGASRGFGQAIAVRFVEEGAKVVCLSRSGCDETLSQIAQIDGLDKDVSAVAISVKCDISNESNIQRMYQSMADVFGDKLHILVNNAALFIFESVENATSEMWDRSSAVNIKGHALMTKHAIPFMKNAGGGSIVLEAFPPSLDSPIVQRMRLRKERSHSSRGAVCVRFGQIFYPVQQYLCRDYRDAHFCKRARIALMVI